MVPYVLTRLSPPEQSDRPRLGRGLRVPGPDPRTLMPIGTLQGRCCTETAPPLKGRGDLVIPGSGITEEGTHSQDGFSRLTGS